MLEKTGSVLFRRLIVYSDSPDGAVFTVIEPPAGSAHVGSVEEVVTVGALAGAFDVNVCLLSDMHHGVELITGLW
jgi:hypothetical protein